MQRGSTHADPPRPEMEQARRELGALVRRVRLLAEADHEPAEFAAELLSLIVPGMGGVAGAVWQVDQQAGPALLGEFRLTAEAPLAQRLLDPQHVGGVARVAEQGESEVIAGNGFSDGSHHPLLLVPVSDGKRHCAVVEVAQRPEIPPAAQQGYLRFLEQLGEQAESYFRNRRLSDLADKESDWQQTFEFMRRIHGSLELRATAYEIANEGRRLIECDKLSVAVRRGSKVRIEAVSGQDMLDRRSEAVRLLDRLVQVVCRAGEPLWYDGHADDLPPQVEAAVQAYVDETDTRTIGVAPLADPEPEPAQHEEDEASAPRKPSEPEIIGAIVVEQINTAEISPKLRQRTGLVCDHATPALSNAMEHEKVFLLPLWRSLGRNYDRLVRRWPTRAAVVAGLVLAGILSLILVPADFHLEGRGTLQPAVRREVFAQVEGVVACIEVDHGETVHAGQRLLSLRNLELESKAADVRGRLAATRQQIRTLRRSLLEKLHESDEETSRLSGQLADLRKSEESLARQLELYRQQLALLEVESPVQGVVLTWELAHQLEQRPVTRGDVLLSVADPEGAWELEIEMPEDRIGHVAQAQAQIEQALPVEYVLSNDPTQTLRGEVSELHSAAEVSGEVGNRVLIRVDVDREDVAHVRPGTEVVAKVYCGRRALGYVWLHDVLAFIRKKILFRL